MIELKNISMIYKEEEVFRNLNLKIQEGDNIIIWGDSGSGKTTLLQIIGKIISPSNGEVIYNENLNNNIIWSFQKDILIDNLSIYENYKFFCSLTHRDYDEYKSKFLKILKALKVSELINITPEFVSSGERKRIFLAIAFTLDPKILILDEPSASIDSNVSSLVLNFLIDFSDKTTIILSTHDTKFQEFPGKHFQIKNYLIEKKTQIEMFP